MILRRLRSLESATPQLAMSAPFVLAEVEALFR